MSVLELKIMAGAESKQFLVDLNAALSRLESLTDKVENLDKPSVTKKATKKAAPVEDDVDDEETESDDVEDTDEETAEETDDEDEKPAKKEKAKPAKAKKLSADDVNDACKAFATHQIKSKGIPGPEARKMVLKILKKKFDVESVSELEPEQFADALKALAVK